MESELKLVFLSLILSFALAGVLSALDAEQLIAQGDSLYHLFNNRGAEAKYQEALKMKPNDSEILWRISRAYVDIGEHLAENQQEAYFEKAINYADKAISANPKNAQGYLRKSIALGKLALFKGVFKSISIVKQVKANLDTCLSLNPNEPTGHYVLGRTHHKLCEKPKIARSLLGLGWAEETISEKEYLKAISLDPTFIMYHYDFALLLQELGKKDEADKQFKLILTLPIRDEDDKDLMAKSKAQIK